MLEPGHVVEPLSTRPHVVTEFTMPGVERVHSAAVEDVWQNFGTCPRVGLTDTEARRRLARFGPNLIATKEKAGKLALLLNQFTSPVVYLLAAAGALSLYFGDWQGKR